MNRGRKNSNDIFLKINKINQRLTVGCNDTYTIDTVMNAIYLPFWKELNKEDRLQCVAWIFEKLLKELNLEEYLDNLLFIPKAGYEEAFSSYDKEDKAIFINPKFIESSSLLCVWNIFHEFQHVIQHQNEDLIREGKIPGNDFYNSFAYYFMYDGMSYRFSSEAEFIYRIKGTAEFCLELYLRNPIETDANNIAYSNLKEIIESNFIIYGIDQETVEDLHSIKNMLLPQFKIITDDIAVDVIKYCQTLIELSYQISKNNLDKSEYNKMNDEIYAAIRFLVENKKNLKISFDIDKLLKLNNYFR